MLRAMSVRPSGYPGKIFRGSEAIRRGLMSPRKLRGRAWQRLFRDVYADARLERTHKLRCKAAQAYLLPDGALIAGRSAAHLFGVPYVDESDPIEVIAPHKFGPIAGLKIHVGSCAESDRHRQGPWHLTTPARICWDLASWLDTVEAVVFADAIAARDLVSRESLIRYALGRKGTRGYVRFMAVVDLMDPAAESAPETRLRVRLVLAGLPRPTAQHEVMRDGVFVARVDLAWPELKIALEYDGRWHASASQLERDRRRLNRLLGADWMVFHVTADQMRHGLDDLFNEVRAAIKTRQRARTRS